MLSDLLSHHRQLKQAPTFLNRVTGTVAILAQGTSWAVAVTQAFWPRFESHGMLNVHTMCLQCLLTQRTGACFSEGRRRLLYLDPAQPMTYDLWHMDCVMCRMTWHVARDLSSITRAMWPMTHDPWLVTYGLGPATYVPWGVPYDLRPMTDNLRTLISDLCSMAHHLYHKTYALWHLACELWSMIYSVWSMIYDRSPTATAVYSVTHVLRSMT